MPELRGPQPLFAEPDPPRHVLGEGPLWDHRCSRLLWVDLTSGELHSWSPVTGQRARATFADTVGMVALRAAGGYVVGVGASLFGLDDDLGPVGRLRSLHDDPSMRCNDGKVDLAGRLWVSTTSREVIAGGSSLWCVDGGSATVVLAGLTLGNGLDWSPDGATFYFTDSATRGIDSYDVDQSTGGISAGRRLIDLAPDEGYPDGLCVDADGHLWVASWGGGAVRRYSPTGEAVGSIEVPAPYVTSCALTGPDLRDLVVTTSTEQLTDQQRRAWPLSGAVLRVRVDVPGKRSALFAG